MSEVGMSGATGATSAPERSSSLRRRLGLIGAGALALCFALPAVAHAAAPTIVNGGSTGQLGAVANDRRR